MSMRKMRKNKWDYNEITILAIKANSLGLL